MEIVYTPGSSNSDFYLCTGGEKKKKKRKKKWNCSNSILDCEFNRWKEYSNWIEGIFLLPSVFLMTCDKEFLFLYRWRERDDIWEFLRPANKRGPLLVLYFSHSASYLNVLIDFEWYPIFFPQRTALTI